MNDVIKKDTNIIKADVEDKHKMLVDLLTKGDFSDFTNEQKANYIIMLCNRLGIDPTSKPLSFIKFRDETGKEREIIYATRDCTDQLRKIHAISITENNYKFEHNLIIATATAVNGQGRTDKSHGVVSAIDRYGKPLNTLAMSNAIMKAETKAKRRVTLSLAGVGVTDESELDTLNVVSSKDIQNIVEVNAVPIVETKPTQHVVDTNKQEEELDEDAKLEEATNFAGEVKERLKVINTLEELQELKSLIDANKSKMEYFKLHNPKMCQLLHSHYKEVLTKFKKKG